MAKFRAQQHQRAAAVIVTGARASRAGKAARTRESNRMTEDRKRDRKKKEGRADGFFLAMLTGWCDLPFGQQSTGNYSAAIFLSRANRISRAFHCGCV
jgi:hypothetical protein